MQPRGEGFEAITDPEKIAEYLTKDATITDFGEVMVVILHMGEEGLHPPTQADKDAAIAADPDNPLMEGGVGGAHAFGPFVNEAEAASWQEAADVVRPCSCEKAFIRLVVPRMLAILGPSGIPLDPDMTVPTGAETPKGDALN